MSIDSNSRDKRAKLEILAVATDGDIERLVKRSDLDDATLELSPDEQRRALASSPVGAEKLLEDLTIRPLRQMLRDLGGTPGTLNKKSLIETILGLVRGSRSQTLRLEDPRPDPPTSLREIRFLRQLYRRYRDREAIEEWLSYEERDGRLQFSDIEPDERRAMARAIMGVIEDDLVEQPHPIELELLRPLREKLLGAPRLAETPVSELPSGGQSGPRLRFGFALAMIHASDGIHTRIEPDHLEAPVVRHIFALGATGSTSSEIAKLLNERGEFRRGRRWLRQELTDLLQDRAYLGDYDGNRMEPIVDVATFTRAAEVLERNTPGTGGFMGRSFRLADRIVCRSCGEKLVKRKGKGSQYHYYVCPRVKECGTKSVDADKLKGAILGALRLELFGHRVRNIVAALRGVDPEEVSGDQLKEEALALDEELRDRDGALLLNLAHLYINSVEVETGSGRCGAAHIYLARDLPRQREDLPTEATRRSIPPPRGPSEDSGPPRESGTKTEAQKRWRVYGDGDRFPEETTERGRAHYLSRANGEEYDLFVDGACEGNRYGALRRPPGGRMEPVTLTEGEYRCLCELAKHAGVAVSVDDISSSISVRKESVRNLISSLRRKVDRLISVTGRNEWMLISTGAAGTKSYIIPSACDYRYRILEATKT